MNAYQIAIDKLHSKLCDTIEDREVPYHLVKKVNSFIDEMKSIGDDQVEANDNEEMDGNDFELELMEI